jgi:tetratricopeptide (TPR) repeat protein
MGYSNSEEQEILFSMHTVFRIGQMQRIKDRLWEVNLTFTSDNNSQLKRLTDYVRDEVGVVSGWFRMGILMQIMGKFQEALDIYDNILETNQDDDLNSFGMSKDLLCLSVSTSERQAGNYSKALLHLEKTLQNYPSTNSSDHRMFGNICQSMASSYYLLGNYPKALSSLEKAIEILQKYLPSNHPDLALNYTAIGSVHHSMGNYAKALPFFEKALEIFKKSLPSDHSHLALNYHNIGAVADLAFLKTLYLKFRAWDPYETYGG